VLPAPDLPRLTDWECPEGWIPTPAGEGEPWAFSYCAPPPRRACEGASLQLPGDPECRRLGTACPEGGDGFPEEAELRALAPGFDGVIRYVDAGARLGGDGSRGAPFRTVAEALARPASGAIVALAPGRFGGRIVPHGGVAIVGACTEGTVLEGPPPEGADDGAPFATVVLGGPGRSLVGNLTITGPRAGLSVEGLTGSVTVRQVLVEAPTWAGVKVLESEPGVLLEEVVVRDVVSHGAGADETAFGLLVNESGGVTARGLVVEGHALVGVLVFVPDDAPGPDLVAEDLVLAQSGQGLLVASDSRVEVRRALIDGAERTGLGIDAGEGPALLLEDVVVRGTRRQGETPWSAGLRFKQGAEVTGRRLLLEDNQDACLYGLGGASGLPTRLTLSDVVCRGSHAGPGDPRAAGLALFGAVELAADRVLLDRNAIAGGFASALAETAAPDVVFTDLVVRDSQEASTGEAGGGLELNEGAQTHLVRALLAGNRDVALLAQGWGRAPETRVTAEHLTVRGVGVSTCGVLPDDYTPERYPWKCVDEAGRSFGGGIGLVAVAGGRLTVSDFEVSGAATAGLLVAREGRLSARRGVVTGNSIGLNVMDETFDADESLRDVYVFGNDTDVGSLEMALPRVHWTPGE